MGLGTNLILKLFLSYSWGKLVVFKYSTCKNDVQKVILSCQIPVKIFVYQRVILILQ